ncbi:MAG TPA: arginase family protein [Solirubrobacterales bacterium]|jgi:arginase|nr:arginase family protein [Solirubrobacterales bacterium]
MRATVTIGVPVDSVGRSGGTETAPATLRELGLPEALGAGDEGDLAVRIRGEQRDPVTGLMASDDVLATTAAVRAAVASSLAAGERPFLIGGCCAELPGALAGARDALGAAPGLAHVDGHLDLYDGETSTTGEAADMPIAVALGLGPEAWVEAAGGVTAIPERTALIGFRDRAESIADGMRQPEELVRPPLLYGADELRERGVAAAAAFLARRLVDAGPFWLHLDVDVLDQFVFPATDYLQPGGLDWDELAALLGPLTASDALIGASLACYNPDKDPDLACGRRLVAALAD